MTAADCDDGRFCNGIEACMPGTVDADERGCAPGAARCLPSQRCSEMEGRCITSCAIEPDADGDTVASVDCDGADCDDTDAMRSPGLTEVCDAFNRDEDCDPSTFGSRDADGDTFVDATCCNLDGTTMRCGDDCNDSRRDAHPGSTEACEHIDNDCDGAVDEGLTVMAYPDLDFDLHGVEDESMRTEVCPGTPGYSLVSDDCDDMSALRHRAQLEICDSVDNDCDGMTDEAPVSIAWYPDQDGDLFGAPDATRVDGGVVISCTPVDGHSSRSSDCDDGDARIHPGARELCNGADDDCNGLADAGALRPGDTEDDDLDGVADVVCGGSDCNDANADVYPGALELCNMRDDDCDTIVDGATAMAMWYLDLDRDGYGDTSSTPITSCTPQGGRVPRAGDCDDDDASIHPGVADPCNAGTMPLDEDCDGSFDESGIRFAFFPDADADGWGASAAAGIVFACRQPAGTSDRPGDCADTDAMRFPTAVEQCQMLDDDCDTIIDEDSDQNWFLDADRDGHGAGTPIFQCIAPAGRVALGDDCDDGDASNFPGNPERCDGRDNDCDTTADEMSTDCMGLTFSTGVCTSGACVLTCDTGHGNCDGSVATGCEVDTRRNPGHCGMCSNACSPGDTCGTLGAPGTCDRARVVEFEGTNGTTIAIRGNGYAVAWGDAATNGLSTLAADAFAATASPLPPVLDVAISQALGCAVTTAGRVLCWGRGTSGERGNGTRTSGTGASEVTGITDAVEVGVGSFHVCAVHADGTLSCWGSNGSGALGTGGSLTVDVLFPALVPGITDAVEVAAMYNTTCVRRGVAGAYYVTCWGSNLSGHCGLGTVVSPITTPGASVVGLPPDVLEFSHGLADALCVRTSDGRALCWGANNGGYGLGVGGGGAISAPVPLPGVTEVLEVALSTAGGCLLRGPATGGEVWCWGYGVGLGVRWINGVTSGTVYSPIRAGLAAMPITDAIAVVAGDQRWCASRASGAVFCMGSDTAGALGDGPPATNSMMPVPVLGLP